MLDRREWKRWAFPVAEHKIGKSNLSVSGFPRTLRLKLYEERGRRRRTSRTGPEARAYASLQAIYHDAVAALLRRVDGGEVIDFIAPMRGGVTIQFWMPTEDAEEMRATCERLGVGVNAFIVTAVKEYLGHDS